jgi:beta-ureidopropionase
LHAAKDEGFRADVRSYEAPTAFDEIAARCLMNTLARIATVAQNRHFLPTLARNREHVLHLMDLACAYRPDLVCLPEAFASVGVKWDHVKEIAEPVPGPTTDLFAKRARACGCYVVCPLFRKAGKRILNAAVIIDRKGHIAGIYDKVFPPTSSPDYSVLEGGVVAGRQVPVFDLDFGRVGVQICFDLNFDENWAALLEKDARLVVWTSAYPGGAHLSARALLNRCHLVSSVRSGASRIVNPCGEVLARTDEIQEVIMRSINLDFVVSHTDFNYTIPDRILKRYGDRVEVRLYQSEGFMLVEPRDPKVTIQRLMREFKFERFVKYLDRHRVAVAALNSGRTAPPQKAAHGNRAQWSK